MNLLNLCLRIPNLGILLYYLFFIVLIPYILIANSSLEILKFYMPLMVAFAHMLSLSGHDKLFGNLYELKPKNFVSFVSTNFINLFAIFGILWQVISYAQNDATSVPRAVVYGIVLFVIVFPMARQGMKFVLDNVDYYMREKTDATFEYNWHLFAFGLLYITFLLGLQAVILSLVDTSRKLSAEDKMKIDLKKYQDNKDRLKMEKEKLLKQMESNKRAKNNAERKLLEMKYNNAQEEENHVNELIENIKNNVEQIEAENNNSLAENELPEYNDNQANNTENIDIEKTKELINTISISDLESFAKKQGIDV
tara:strand:- start:18 stop:947 length:930 start_codon:yes stop_codon:yes gene_type:complete